MPGSSAGEKKDVKPIVFFSCQGVGHKSPNCPKRKKTKSAKRVKTKKSRTLAGNELYAWVGEKCLVVMVDTGADLTILPKEVVDKDQLTGRKIQSRCANGTPLELEVAAVEIEICGDTISRHVEVIPGDTIGWIGMLSVPLMGEKNRELLLRLMEFRENMAQVELTYYTPRLQGKELKGVVLKCDKDS